MKATQDTFSRLASRAAAEARVFFFCGPDEAGTHDGAARVVSLLAEPGERIELSGAELRRDPVRLGDEARSSSLFGDSRHIFVRAQGDEAHDAVANLLDSDVEACPVLIVASGATDKSRTAKLLADRPDALVAMFYPPDLRAVTRAVRGMADAAGLTIGDDIAERIARGANLDTRLAQSEVAKLALFLDASPERPSGVSRDDLDQVSARTEDDGFASLVDVVLGGQSERLPGELKRLRDLGLSPVGLLLAFERRTAQLAALSAKLGPRGDVEALIRAERSARRVWGDHRALSVQLQRWRGQRLHRLVEKFVQLHQFLMVNSQDGEMLLSQGLAQVAGAFRERGQRA